LFLHEETFVQFIAEILTETLDVPFDSAVSFAMTCFFSGF